MKKTSRLEERHTTWKTDIRKNHEVVFKPNDDSVDGSHRRQCTNISICIGYCAQSTENIISFISWRFYYCECWIFHKASRHSWNQTKSGTELRQCSCRCSVFFRCGSELKSISERTWVCRGYI